MIIINKSNNINVIKATLSEKSEEVTPIYELELFNFFTNVTYKWLNISPTAIDTRVDTITIVLSEEYSNKELEVGQYKYEFWEMVNGSRQTLVETGICKVIANDTDVIYTGPSEETDDDFITYTI